MDDESSLSTITTFSLAPPNSIASPERGCLDLVTNGFAVDVGPVAGFALTRKVAGGGISSAGDTVPVSANL